MTAYAAALGGAQGEARAALLQAGASAGLPLAYALKEICLATWASEPARAAEAAADLAELAPLIGGDEAAALADWTAGLVAITAGSMEQAVERLDTAVARFTALGLDHAAASTQVGRLIALGTLGRYDEAVASGLQARDIFLAGGDELAAGKIEQNLGTIALRRDRYSEAELLHRSAGRRFAAAGEIDLLVAAENALAADLAPQLRLREATEHYQRALARAQQAGLELREAEIECNLGNLALAQGHFDQALAHLERSRRRYAALGMPHETAVAEQELAEAYLQLNMAEEAATIYRRVTPTFAALGMRAEQAWAMAHHGQAALLLDRRDQARALFDGARRRFAEEGNAVSVALVTLFEAQLAYQSGDYGAAAAEAAAAEAAFAQARSHGRALLARWLLGEALRAQGRLGEARLLLEAARREAEQRALPQLAQRCHGSLGLLALAAGDRPRAEAALRQAVAMAEDLRAPLPSEELRTAFIADKLAPYSALVRLCLEHSPSRVADALGYAERARSRALAEILGRAVQPLVQPRDPFEAELAARLSELRAELNWLYGQLAGDGGDDDQPGLTAAIHEREAALLDLSRQLQMRGGELPGAVEPLDLPALQADLGAGTALVAYYSLDGELLAFVVTDRAVEVVRDLAGEAEVEELAERLRFQIEALRRGARAGSAHHDQLVRRARHYLGRLYTLLLAPLEAALGERRLVVVPHRALHYVPFHALHDGERYVIERREVCTVPGASVLRRCLQRPRLPLRRALLVGVPDARAPRVRDEIQALAPLFPDQVTLLGPAARAEALRRHAPEAELLHLACHGIFRPDSPLFSALTLADGRFTTRDAYGLALRCNLVVLSACETGVSSVAPGDELIGLARGFFAAGAPALLVSLWTVDDASTATLMAHFYRRMQAGDAPATALRAAQRALMREQPHPFYWAPFVLMGRW
ncbi:MAG TPA: CHAT domain-containing protein [Chloroflexaceae bacterium]|nr:CHAT domain-containing protein [Chloroflexaceae bacterium]